MREKIAELCRAEEGYMENPAGSNHTKYGEWYGVDYQPWCAMFVSWIFFTAGFKWPKIDTLKGFSYVPTMYIRAKQNNWITIKPQRGDVVLFDWNGDKAADHTGIFDSWVIEGQTFKCWEGNTSYGNNSNGGQVMLRERKVSQVQAFVNVIDKPLHV